MLIVCITDIGVPISDVQFQYPMSDSVQVCQIPSYLIKGPIQTTYPRAYDIAAALVSSVLTNCFLVLNMLVLISE